MQKSPDLFSGADQSVGTDFRSDARPHRPCPGFGSGRGGRAFFDQCIHDGRTIQKSQKTV